MRACGNSSASAWHQRRTDRPRRRREARRASRGWLIESYACYSAKQTRPWRTGGLVGSLGKPFAHVRAWTLPRAIWKKKPNPKGMTPEEEDRAWKRWDAVLAEKYWNRDLMNGAIPICHLGCALRQWLVVKGKCVGQIWNDDRVDDKGIAPLLERRKPVSFAVWYETWLDVSLRSAKRKK